jgi:chromosome partitioning protein
MVVRKLLVASQKGGVGKTTTSMNLAAAAAQAGTRVLLLDADPLSNISTALNLAEHPRRRILRQEGIDLPGVLVPDVVAGLDVLSPYEGGPCRDEDFERLLRALESAAARPCYGCLIVDVPPFLGGNSVQLLHRCEDFLLVMRAEAMAYRTLPAFLERVQRSSRDGHALPMRGILLTLPEGEQPGCRWERELRGRFGARVLPEVIPHDEQIGEALRQGQISSHSHADAPAARQYHQLVGQLHLSDESSPTLAVDRLLQALRQAAESVGPSAAAPPPAAEPPPEAMQPSAEAPVVTPTLEPIKPSSSRPRRLSRSGESLRPLRTERTLSAASPSPVRMKVVPAQVPPVADPPAAAAAVPPPAANALAQLWPLWILLGAVLGGGLRFVPLTAALLPILVGLGVALLVVVGLFALAAQERNASSTAPEQPHLHKAKNAKPRKDSVSTRLAALARSPKRRQGDPDVN